MEIFDILALLVTLAAAFSWVNYRFIRLPTTIGVMVISLVFSLGLVALGKAGVGGPEVIRDMLSSIDFDAALLQGMLGALLFAGALHIDLDDLKQNRWVIALLATVGVLLSTALVGLLTFWVFGALGFDVPLALCLLFGALISPTDPIAVGAILRKAGVPPSLLAKITGESLFNDGVGVVVFLVVLGIATGGHGVSAGEVAHMLAVEVVGGIVFGGIIGWIAYRMLRSVDNYQVEILLTLAIVTGGYALAQALHISGPLAMVVSGLLIGNRGKALAMSDVTVEHLEVFWELVDEFLNALLFVMIGIEVLILDLAPGYLLAGLVAIPLVVGVRFVSVGLPVTALRPLRRFSDHAVKVLTWSGLRGGISVALALSIPAGPHRPLLVTTTYVVVLFSIVVQGLTIGPFARRLSPKPAAQPEAA
jgi:CPA1 family monovalent cation:H+ antiporter